MLVQMSNDQRDNRSAPSNTFINQDDPPPVCRSLIEQESCEPERALVQKQTNDQIGSEREQSDETNVVQCRTEVKERVPDFAIDDQQNRSCQDDQPEVLVNDAKDQQQTTKVSIGEPAVVTSSQKQPIASKRIEVRLLVRRREAGALIGKRGANIKRMRETYSGSTFNIPDTGNGPERVVCISATNWDSLDAILLEISKLFLDKNSALHVGDEQVEMKQLINSAYAGSLIGIGGQAIRKLRNDSKAAIKIYEMCCPLSDERVCAIKARPPVVVSTIRLIHDIMLASQTTIKAPIQAHKPYDALNFDMNLVDKYGGHEPDDYGPKDMNNLRVTSNLNCLANGHNPNQFQHQHHHHQHRPPIPQAPGQMLHHFHDPMNGGELLPVVMSQSGFRPAAMFAPLQQVDFMPLNPLVNGRQLMPINQPTNNRPSSIGHRSNSFGNHHQQRTLSSPSQTYRNQRFQPYSMSNELQARLNYLQGQQTQRDNDRLMFGSQLLFDQLSQQINQNVRPYVDRNSRQFNQRRGSGSQIGQDVPMGVSVADSSARQYQISGNQQAQTVGCPCSVVKTSILQATGQLSCFSNQSIESDKSSPSRIDKQQQDKSNQQVAAHKLTVDAAGKVASGAGMDQT